MSDALKEISEAIYMLDHNKITVGEYEEKLKPWHDVEPIKHGYWTRPYKNKAYRKCSVCGEIHCGIPWNAQYCPFCGAKMDEVTE